MSQYKVGDWVVITQHARNWAEEMDSEDGKIVQITELYDMDGGTAFDYINRPKKWNFIAEHPEYAHCRPATPAEIALVTKICTPKFKVGDKVVPHDKSTGCPFRNSKFKRYGIKYLIIVDIINKNGDIKTDTPENSGAEYYRSEDLTLYQEPATVKESSKELTELPEKWFIKVTKDNIDMLSKWRTCGSCAINSNLLSLAHGDLGYSIDSVPTEYNTEITTEQFKKWVLGEDPLIVGSKTSEVTEVNKTHQHSVGDYFVALKENVYGILIPIGGIGRITKLESRDGGYVCEAPIGDGEWCLNDSVANIKWFKTLEEATKFSESLKPVPVIEKPEVYKEAIYNAEDKHRGKRIIEFLISKGGINRNWRSDATDAWWYIDPDNRIDYGTSLPEGYTENTSFEPSVEPTTSWAPSVGDYITITKSTINWVSEMDKFIGKTYRVTQVLDKFKGKITFAEGEKWSWFYDQTHFREATVEEILGITSIQPPKAIVEDTSFIGEAVQCTTQKEWDIVISVFNPVNQSSQDWKKNRCINLRTGRACEIDWYKRENYRIISFKEWCNRNGVTPEPKPVELELKEEMELLTPVKVDNNISNQLLII